MPASVGRTLRLAPDYGPDDLSLEPSVFHLDRALADLLGDPRPGGGVEVGGLPPRHAIPGKAILGVSSLDVLLDGRRPRDRTRILLAEALEQARLLEGLHRVPAHVLPVQRVAGG